MWPPRVARASPHNAPARCHCAEALKPVRPGRAVDIPLQVGAQLVNDDDNDEYLVEVAEALSPPRTRPSTVHVAG